MTTSPTSVRLDSEIKARLDALAKDTHRTVSFYINQILQDNLAEVEYAYRLKSEAEAVRLGEVRGYTIEELEKELL